MKKKILVLLLVVFALTFVAQLAMISHPQTAGATGARGKCCMECYWETDGWGNPVLECFEYCGAECYDVFYKAPTPY